MVVVLREAPGSSGKWQNLRQDFRDRSRQAMAQGAAFSLGPVNSWENFQDLAGEEAWKPDRQFGASGAS